MKTKRILGIDPGTGRTGWGIIEENGTKTIQYISHGCITTDQEFAMADRLYALFNEVNKLITMYKPDQIIVEQIFFARNAKTAISVAQARGVILVCAASYSIPTYEYTSLTVKKSLSGSGKSDKKEMQTVVRKVLEKDVEKLLFNTKDKGFDDSADALAIAIHHVYKTVVGDS